MQRVIVPKEKFRSEQLSPGVELRSFYPGGKDGPNRELYFDTPGGQVWSETFLLGDPKDAFQMLLPDIRLPANQYWPLHWHDCWTAVLVLEGSCVIGDWWMKPGDLFITEPSLEYGPLVIGPHGCRMFEIFARAHLAPGGYAPEYRDHPTLEGTTGKVFFPRSEPNLRNEGHQLLSCEGTPGITKTRMSNGSAWDLGEAADPDRGVLKDTRLSAGQVLAAHTRSDWHAFVLLGGSAHITDRKLVKDDVLTMQPNSRIADIVAGAEGVELLELSRTARGMTARPAV